MNEIKYWCINTSHPDWNGIGFATIWANNGKESRYYIMNHNHSVGKSFFDTLDNDPRYIRLNGRQIQRLNLDNIDWLWSQ